MKFSKQLALLKLPSWTPHYADYDALKRLAEQFGDSHSNAEPEHSDDSVTREPRHARAAAARDASARALAAAGGVEEARPASEAAFLSRAAQELARAEAFFLAQVAECASAVEEAARQRAAVSALLDAASAEGGDGALPPAAMPAARYEASPASPGVSSAAPAAAVSSPAPAPLDAVGSALSAASAAVLRASAMIDDLQGFATLNLAALAKAAKKFDKRWLALARGSFSLPIAPRIAALCAASGLADGTALRAQSERCSALMQSLPPQPPPTDRRARGEGPGGTEAGATGAAGPLAANGSPATGRSSDGVALVKGIDIASLLPGTVTRLRVRLAEGALDEPLTVPVLVARGRHAGPVLGITSALHGNELAGIPVIRHVFDQLDVEQLSGTIVAVPVVNTPGFLRYQRGFSDGQDLNRIMPGKKGGSASQAFAHALMTRIVRHVDFLLDLHTASFGRVNSLYVRADMRDAHTHRLALQQRPQIIVHNSGPDGSLRGACAALGKPCVTIEIGDPQVIDPAMTAKALRGVRNTLHHLKMLSLPPGDEEAPAAEPPVVVSRSFWLFSASAGILTVMPAVAAWVKRGDVVAEIHNVWGELVDRIVVATDAIVVGKSTNPVCNTGDRLLHLGVCEQRFEEKADDGHQ